MEVRSWEVAFVVPNKFIRGRNPSTMMRSESTINRITYATSKCDPILKYKSYCHCTLNERSITKQKQKGYAR